MGSLDTPRSSPENEITARAASVSDPSLDQLRAGDMLDHDGSTWTVTRHERFAHGADHADRWTLTSGSDTLLLEHGPGAADFRLFRRATLADVAVEGRPFLNAMRDGESINAIEYQGARYERTDTDVRTGLQDEQEVQVRSGRLLARAQLDRKLGGVVGGIAAYLGVPSVLLRFVVLLGLIGLLAAGIFVWSFSYAVWGAVALAVGGTYGGAVLALPSAPLLVEADTALSRYWLYEGEEGVMILECWDESNWRAYEGRAASPDEFENILPGERRREETDPEAGVGTALRRLREGSLVDYDGSTWEVFRHTTYEDGRGSVEQWMLKHGTGVRVLECEDDAGPVFRLSTPVDLVDVTVGDQPLPNAVSEGTAPDTVTYQGTGYVAVAERTRFIGSTPSDRFDFLNRPRSESGVLGTVLRLIATPFAPLLFFYGVTFRLVGVLQGIAERIDVSVRGLRWVFYISLFVLFVVAGIVFDSFGLNDNWMLGVPLAYFATYLLLFVAMPKAPPEPSEGKRVRYRRYESDEGFVVLECRGKNDWSAHVGREVAPREFENVLPEPEEGFLTTLWDKVSFSEDPTPTELSGSISLHEIREGYLLDHDLQTWTVTEHTKYPYEGWPSDVWTLEHEGGKRELEYDRTEVGTFRLYRHVPVDGMPFSGRGMGPPDTIEYEGTQYVLTEKDIRVHEEGQVREGEEDYISFLARSFVDRKLLGACGGVARHLRLPSWLVRFVVSIGVFYSVVATVIAAVLLIGGDPLPEYWKITGVAILGMIWGYYHLFALFVPEPPPKVLSHYWVYESDEDDLLTLRCKEEEWTMRVGREVEPYEFDNILPPSEG